MLTVRIGRDAMLGSSSTEDIEKLDMDATEQRYRELIIKALGGEDVEVEFMDNAPTYLTRGELDGMDELEIQQILEDVWDRQMFWVLK